MESVRSQVLLCKSHSELQGFIETPESSATFRQVNARPKTPIDIASLVAEQPWLRMISPFWSGSNLHRGLGRISSSALFQSGLEAINKFGRRRRGRRKLKKEGARERAGKGKATDKERKCVRIPFSRKVHPSPKYSQSCSSCPDMIAETR